MGDITDIILQDIITDLRVITDCITDITDTVTDITGTDTATDITDTDILITIMEEDKKSGIFWKINFSQRQRSHKFKQYGPHRISTTKFKICSRCYYSWQKLDK